jgi:hypothetical protein
VRPNDGRQVDMDAEKHIWSPSEICDAISGPQSRQRIDFLLLKSSVIQKFLDASRLEGGESP